MGAAETVKDFVRIAQTAGLSKDVIDLLEKKVSLLADRVASLEEENATFLRENRTLHIAAEELKKQIEQHQPKGDKLDETCEKMLVALANFDGHDGITDGELIQNFRLPKARGDFLFSQLKQRKFVSCSSGQMGRGMFYYVTEAGLQYLANHNLL